MGNFCQPVLFLSLLCEVNMLLQLPLDRVLKIFLAIKVKECHTAALVQEREDLTLREQNVITYMAGYVVQKLTKRFKKRCKDVDSQRKRDLFLCVLSAMESVHDEGQVVNPTGDWVQMIAR